MVLDDVGDVPTDNSVHPATLKLLSFFTYDHLPEHLRPVSALCCTVAHDMFNMLPDGSELRFGLRQLLLAKDAFVRHAVLTHANLRQPRLADLKTNAEVIADNVANDADFATEWLRGNDRDVSDT